MIQFSGTLMTMGGSRTGVAPASLLDIQTVNGEDPETNRKRSRFEDLTALFPDEKLHLDFGDPTKGRDAAAAMYDEGADIVYQVAGGAGVGG